MLPWIFAVLLALNLALFLWGYRNEHLREPPLPPVPAGQYEIRLLSEVEREPPAVRGADRPRPGVGTAPGLPNAGDAPTPAAPVAGGEEHVPPDDLVEPDSTGEETRAEQAPTGDAGTEDIQSPTTPKGPESTFDPELQGEPPPFGPADAIPAADPEPTGTIDPEPPGDTPPEPPLPHTPDSLPEPPPRDIPPFPELPIQQPRTPGGVSAGIESTA